MQALILAGGAGKRLRPLTEIIPKVLVPIRNVAIIEWQIRYLKYHGIDEIIICAGYRADQIIDHLKMRGGLGVKISYSIEKSPLGTGGAIRKAASDLIRDETFFVINGDIITDIDVGMMKDATDSIAVIPLRTGYGTLGLEGDAITSFREKREVLTTFMNAGIYHLSRTVLRDLPEQGDIEKTLFPEYARTGRLRGVRFKRANWYSIDSFKDVEACEQNIQEMIK